MSGQISQQHIELISKIYDLPLYPEKWQAVLDEFAPMMNASFAGVAVVDQVYVEHRINAVTSKQGKAFVREYSTQFPPSEQNSFSRLAAKPKRGFVKELDVLGLDNYEQYGQRPAIQWLNEYYDIFHGAATCLNLDRVWTDILHVMYPREHGPITAQEKATGNFFLEHFAKSTELGRAFGVLKSRFDGALTVLDHFHIGVFVLAANGEVILKNNEADRIVDKGDGFGITREAQLYADDLKERAELKQAIVRAIDTASAKDDQAETIMTVVRSSGSDPYLVEIAPIRDDEEIERRFRGALVFVIDPAKTDVISIEGMQALYGLTNSESEVCKLVAEGCATDEIADIKNITRETVRNYIKQVLHKTGTSNRTQLVRLALNMNLPIDPAANK